MQVGIKIFPDRIHKIPKYAEIADFIEIMATEELNPTDLKEFSVPFVIHALHTGQGVNPADSTLEKVNLKAIKRAIEAADAANSDIIVLHAGKKLNKNCSLKNAINFFKKINDPRIIVENLSLKSELCVTLDETAYFKKAAEVEFCLDFGHVVIAALSLKKDYKELIKQFMKLNPAYFHITDGFVDSEEDEHLNFGKGDYDLDFFKRLIGNKRVALETEKESSKKT